MLKFIAVLLVLFGSLNQARADDVLFVRQNPPVLRYQLYTGTKIQYLEKPRGIGGPIFQMIVGTMGMAAGTGGLLVFMDQKNEYGYPESFDNRTRKIGTIASGTVLGSGALMLITGGFKLGRRLDARREHNRLIHITPTLGRAMGVQVRATW